MKSSIFKMLAIYAVKTSTTQAWGHRKIAKGQMDELLRLLRQGTKGEQFILDQKRYVVKNISVGNYVNAEEIKGDETIVKTPEHPLVVWVNYVKDFVIVGVSEKSNAESCRTEVFDLGVQLRAQTHLT